MVSPITHLTKNKLLLPLLVVSCLVLVTLVNLIGLMVVGVVIGLIAFVATTYISYRLPRYNIIILLGISFLMPFFIKVFRLYGVPISNAIEGLCILLLIILYFKKGIRGSATLIGILITAWIGYQVIEVLNPNATSRVASFIAIRALIPLLCGFYIVYNSIETKKDVLTYLTGLLILASMSALYGLWQEFAGLPGYDFRWATSDERLYNLLFTWGRMRKFSFFFSPADFGMIMAITGTGALVGFFLIKKRTIKIFFAVAGIISLWAMLYSGTRTAMVMMVIGFVIFAAITLNRQVLIACGFMALVLVGLVLRPTSSRTLFVMMTAFYASDDPSMNVRLRNQQMIRSHIQQHPIGFGMGTTGYLGMKYAPHTFVGAFPPDSEFVKIAIETGWIGLFFWCTVLALIFGYGINLYFKIREKEWKALLTIMLVMLFMMIVSQYPQEFFRSHVLSLIFAATVAIIAKIGSKFKQNKSQPITEEYESR